LYNNRYINTTSYDHEQSTAIDDWHTHEEPLDYNNDNVDENDSDFDDYEESRRKKGKKVNDLKLFPVPLKKKLDEF
jgi:hypothetical protein